MEQPSTSSQEKENTEEVRPENLGQITMSTLKRLVWKLKLDQTSDFQKMAITDPVTRTARYTGMHKLNIKKLLAFGNIKDYEPVEFDRRVIHLNLTNMYTIKRRIPTIKELFYSLYEILPSYTDLDLFTKMLIQMGYVFYKFPGSKSLRVMEKKSVTFERYKYVKSIQNYRKEKVPIVYIGFATLNKEMNLFNSEKTLHTNPKNILNHVLFTATVEEIGNVEVIPQTQYEALPDIIKKWLLDICTSKSLPPESICVLEDSKIFRKALIDVPTWKSIKADMVDWLQEHNIHCHINMPKADLLQLIETCTDTNKNTFVLDNLLRLHKYPSLRLPQCINGLSLVPFVIKLLNDKDNENFRNSLQLKKAFDSVSKSDLKYFSNIIQQQEKMQLEEDMKIDDLLDDLVININSSNEDKHGKEDEVIFPYSDSE